MYVLFDWNTLQSYYVLLNIQSAKLCFKVAFRISLIFIVNSKSNMDTLLKIIE